MSKTTTSASIVYETIKIDLTDVVEPTLIVSFRSKRNHYLLYFAKPDSIPDLLSRFKSFYKRHKDSVFIIKILDSSLLSKRKLNELEVYLNNELESFLIQHDNFLKITDYYKDKKYGNDYFAIYIYPTKKQEDNYSRQNILN